MPQLDLKLMHTTVIVLINYYIKTINSLLIHLIRIEKNLK